MNREELAWSPAQTACINQACRRKCDVRVGFDLFVSGEILCVWCRFLYKVALDAFSLGLQLNVFSGKCLILFTCYPQKPELTLGVELWKWTNKSVIKAVTKDNKSYHLKTLICSRLNFCTSLLSLVSLSTIIDIANVEGSIPVTRNIHETVDIIFDFYDKLKWDY